MKELDSLKHLKPHLTNQIHGQDHVIARVVSVFERGELGLSKPGRPKGSFLFLGPTGVGKTELTLAFTRYLLGEDALVRFDMSEFQTQDASRLLLGERFGEAGLLGQALANRSEGTILFDEIEKSNPRIMDLFLQVLDAARITLASGETLDLSNWYVVMTSNIGSTEILGLQYAPESTLERHVLSRAQQILRPEIFARITEKLVFHRLSYEHQIAIAQKFLFQEIEFLKKRGIAITVGADVLPFLVRKGFHPKLGARPMRDAIEKSVGDAVAAAILDGHVPLDHLRVDATGYQLEVVGHHGQA
jgi:ATP-dependent Clp protease ATP-binding subunit ClpA